MDARKNVGSLGECPICGFLPFQKPQSSRTWSFSFVTPWPRLCHHHLPPYPVSTTPMPIPSLQIRTTHWFEKADLKELAFDVKLCCEGLLWLFSRLPLAVFGVKYWFSIRKTLRQVSLPRRIEIPKLGLRKLCLTNISQVMPWMMRNWQSTCLACMRPWVGFSALYQPGVVVHVYNLTS